MEAEEERASIAVGGSGLGIGLGAGLHAGVIGGAGAGGPEGGGSLRHISEDGENSGGHILYDGASLNALHVLRPSAAVARGPLTGSGWGSGLGRDAAGVGVTPGGGGAALGLGGTPPAGATSSSSSSSNNNSRSSKRLPATPAPRMNVVSTPSGLASPHPNSADVLTFALG